MSTGTPRTIFYSWQADHPNTVNRGFIEEAMSDAINLLKLDRTIYSPERDELVIDQATKGVPGSPPIAATILQKIVECAVFVADITPIGVTGPKNRSTPNPNVVFELGYAWKRLQERRILLVLNRAFASNPDHPEYDLPFDIRGNRYIPYKLEPGTEKKAARNQLVRAFEEAFRAILPTLAPEKAPRPPLNLQTWIEQSGSQVIFEQPFAIDIDGDGFDEPILALGRRDRERRPFLDLLVAHFSGGGWRRITAPPIYLPNAPTQLRIAPHKLTGERYQDLVVSYNTGGTWSGQVILRESREAGTYELAPRELRELRGPLGLHKFVWNLHYRSQVTFRPRLDAPTEDVIEELRFDRFQASEDSSLASYLAEHPNMQSLHVYRTWRWNQQTFQFELLTQEIPMGH